MKVLIVASKFPPEYSGPGVRIPRLYDSIAKQLGIDNIQILCGGIEQTDNQDYEFNNWQVRRRVASYIRKKKFPFNVLPARITESIAYLTENIIGLKALNHYKDIDYVHIIGHSGITAAALHWARKNNIPTVLELVTAIAKPTQKFLVLGKTYPPKNCVIVTFRSDAEKSCQEAGYEKQVWKRPNPINEITFKPESDNKYTLRKKLTDFSESDIIISTVAKIMPQKNQIFLIEVLKNLPGNFKLIIAGPKVTEGPLYKRDRNYFNRLENMISLYELQNRVLIIADYVEAADYMKASDIYALPAYNEGFATPMIEAIACGLPVIANEDESAFREWIKNGENGFLCPLEPESWVKAIQKAEKLSKEQRIDESEKIIRLAGQKNIYKTYCDLINNLVQKKQE